jgi:EpsI family protein
LDAIPTRIGDWLSVNDPPLAPDILQQLRASSYIGRTYDRGRDTLQLFITYYSRQRAGENIHSPLGCLSGGGWEITRRGNGLVIVAGKPLEINHYLIQNVQRRAQMLYWYQTRKHITAGDFSAKLALMWDSLTEGDTSSAFVRVTVPDTPQAYDNGLRFAAQLIPEVQRCLGW